MLRASGKPDATSWNSVPGISLSTVQQQDEQGQNSGPKLIEMFESHQHKEQFLKDMSLTQRSTGSVCIARKCCKIWSRHWSFNSLSIQQNFDTPIAGIICCNCKRNLKTHHKFSKGQQRFHFEPWLHHWEEFQPKNQAQPIWETSCGLRGERHAVNSKEDGNNPTLLSKWKTILAKKKSCFTTK